MGKKRGNNLTFVFEFIYVIIKQTNYFYKKDLMQ